MSFVCKANSYSSPDFNFLRPRFRLLFEGEYLNGQKNGKGKEYNYDGELIFEGEYLNGKKWNGKGKEFNRFHGLVYDGEYVNGEKLNDN